MLEGETVTAGGCEVARGLACFGGITQLCLASGLEFSSLELMGELLLRRVEECANSWGSEIAEIAGSLFLRPCEMVVCRIFGSLFLLAGFPDAGAPAISLIRHTHTQDACAASQYYVRAALGAD